MTETRPEHIEKSGTHRRMKSPHLLGGKALGLSMAIFCLAWLCPVAKGHGSKGQDIIVRSSIVSSGDIWVGQRVLLQVEVLALEGWAKIDRLPGLEVPGTYVFYFQSQGNRLSETFNGRTYSGQQYEISLFPQRGGMISVPAVEVVVHVKRWGEAAHIPPRKVKISPVKFEVKVPAGAETIPMIISATELDAQQQWKPEAVTFKVGDAVKRTIVLLGPDISGMVFPSLQFPATDGLGIYRGEPSVDDYYNRGELTGKRTETVTYVFERKGTYELPEIEVSWWDLETKQLKRAVLPARKLKVSPAAGIPVGTDYGPLCFLSITVILFLVLGIVWFFRQTIRQRWQAWQKRRSETEKAYYRWFNNAARAGDPKKATNDLMQWLGRIHPGSGAARLDVFLQEYGDEEALAEANRLFKSLEMTQPEKWDGKVLSDHMASARKRWRQSQHQKVLLAKGLPPLNPLTSPGDRRGEGLKSPRIN